MFSSVVNKRILGKFGWSCRQFKVYLYQYCYFNQDPNEYEVIIFSWKNFFISFTVLTEREANSHFCWRIRVVDRQFARIVVVVVYAGQSQNRVFTDLFDLVMVRLIGVGKVVNYATTAGWSFLDDVPFSQELETYILWISKGQVTLNDGYRGEKKLWNFPRKPPLVVMIMVKII